jgi:hypothetical protein
VLVLPVDDKITTPPAPLLPLSPIQRQSFDYSGLDAAMEFTDEAMRNARRLFAGFPQGRCAGESAGGQADVILHVAGEDSAGAQLTLRFAAV